MRKGIIKKLYGLTALALVLSSLVPAPVLIYADEIVADPAPVVEQVVESTPAPEVVIDEVVTETAKVSEVEASEQIEETVELETFAIESKTEVNEEGIEKNEQSDSEIPANFETASFSAQSSSSSEGTEVPEGQSVLCIAGTISCHGPFTNYTDPDWEGEPYCYEDCSCTGYDDGNFYTWTFVRHGGVCDGDNGGGGGPAPVNGVCGSAHNQPVPAAPTSNLCEAGSPSAVSERHGNSWVWICTGSDGGSIASCSAPHVASAPENRAPTITLVGSNPITLTVGDTFTDPGATATDLEDGNITHKITKTGSVNTAIVSTTTITYSVVDSGGLSTSTSRTVIVKAATPPPCTVNCGGSTNHAPTITLVGANPLIIAIGQTFVDPGATATDPEDGNITNKIVKTGTVNTAVVGTTTITYSVTDNGGLSASITRTVVVKSTVPPCTTNCGTDPCVTPKTSGGSTNESILRLNNDKPLQDIIYDSGYLNNVLTEQKHYQIWDVSQNASTTFEVTFLDQSAHSGNVFGYYVNGNTSTFIPLFKSGTLGHPDYTSVGGYTAPISFTVSSVQEVSFAISSHNESNQIFLFSTRDSVNPGGQNHVLSFDTRSTSGMVSGSYILGFEDIPHAWANADRDFNDVVVVVRQKGCTPKPAPINQPPVIALVGANPIVLTVGDTFTDPGATATDLEQGNITSLIVKTGSVNTALVSTSTLTYTVTDNGGLTASTSRTVIVKAATPPPCTVNCGGGGSTNHPPVITLVGANPFIINVGDTFTDPGATATDQEDGDLTSIITKTGTVNPSVVSTTTITYSVTDTDGLSASTTRTVIVKATTTPPCTVNCGGGGTNQCTINIVSDTTNKISNDFAVATYSSHPSWTANIPGATWIWKTFSVQNPTADEFTTFTKTFSLSAASHAQITEAKLTLAADNSYTVSLNGTQIGADATEENYRDGNKDIYNVAANLQVGTNTLSFTVKNWALQNGTPESNPAGLLYKLEIKTEDQSCNTNPQNNPPTITLLGDNPLIISVGDTFTDPGATAYDQEDGDITANIVRSGEVSTSTISTSTLVYSITDSQGQSASTSRTVIVKATTTPPCTVNCGGNGGGNHAPVITLIGANPFIITLGQDFIDPGASSTDAEDGDLTSRIVVTGTVSTSTISTSTLIYSVTDNGGLSASTTREVIVKPVATTTPAACADTVDNDNDGKVDSADPGCHSDNDPTDGDNTYDPNDNNETDAGCTSNCGGGGDDDDDNGGGGGGGSSGGRRRDISNLLSGGGEVLGETSCSYLRDFLRRDWNNDPAEMLKLQSFLNVFEKENLSLTQTFDAPTFAAVERFQNKYFGDILEPWGHTAPTGFVYILTKKKINEIFCLTMISLTPAEQQEIAIFRAYLESLEKGGTIGGSLNGNNGVGIGNGFDTTTPTSSLGTTTAGDIKDNNEMSDSVVRNAAASLLAMSKRIFSDSKYVLLFIILVIVIAALIKWLFTSPTTPTTLTKVEKDETLPNKLPAKEDIKKDDSVINLPPKSEDKKDETPEEIVIENDEDENILG